MGVNQWNLTCTINMLKHRIKTAVEGLMLVCQPLPKEVKLLELLVLLLRVAIVQHLEV